MRQFFVLLDKENRLLGQQFASTSERAIKLFERYSRVLASKALTFSDYQANLHFNKENYHDRLCS